MKDTEFKEKMLEEIESCLWRLGDYTDGTDNSVFPNFDMDSHELEYGVQREDNIIFVETKGKTDGGERILARVTVELIKG
ncbi:MAG: hypothetical protein J6T31_02565 [Methanobrevibacter sp.]|nr:hypothetical protein [Methanobrevibacter sp.]